ncbi:hypothetical protein [Jannaschia seohaensis]|uniref:Sulfotransferase family protein n=1 Tax=Jannaschia seohaensis TaxID=475081 RepID=A0A2Y9AW55_9RHOB|nr:hypothetical protein [Jannaschia seohaensis]PWJ16926.1 hypothetical protein BCF38_10738 [Jannaschia seohaensis]SSA48135.1 hypothetical protein SAMN05421539_10738 [Jannaschia seohaensis]
MTPKDMPPITLHLGAHRTGTSSLQRLLNRERAGLEARGIALWSPKQTRAGLFTGLLGDPGRRTPKREIHAHRAAGRIAMRRRALAADGITRLIVSDENMLGGLRENLLMARIYPTVTARMARIGPALPGTDRVCLSIRSPDAWWTSTFAFLMSRGFAPPDRATLDAILRSRRGWRGVVEDLARAFPAARLTVWTHEEMAARPAAGFALLTGAPPPDGPVPHLQASLTAEDLRARLRDEGCMADLPELAGAYSPFTPDERAALRDAHAEDLAWLRGGADGLADFVTRRPEEAPPRDRKGLRDEGRNRSTGKMDAAGRG